MSLFSKPKQKPATKSSKAKTTATSNIISGGIKTKNKKKVAFLSIAGVLVLAVLGYSGYTLYQNHSHSKLAKDFQAHAANYGAIIVDNSNVRALACWKQYPTAKPDEVWIMVGRKNGNVAVTGVVANIGNRVLSESFSRGWWAGTLQIHKLSVGRANILNGAYIEGIWSSNAIKGGATGGAYYFGGPQSLTGSYSGSRIAHPKDPSLRYPLIKGLPVCNY